MGYSLVEDPWKSRTKGVIVIPNAVRNQVAVVHCCNWSTGKKKCNRPSEYYNSAEKDVHLIPHCVRNDKVPQLLTF